MKNPKPKIKVNQEVLKVLKLIKHTKEQYRTKDLVSYLIGKENNLLRSHNVSSNELFGCGKEKDSSFWNSLIRHMLVNKILNKKIFFPPVPKKIIKLFTGSMSELLLFSQDVSSNKLKSEGFEFKFNKLSPALRDLLK